MIDIQTILHALGKRSKAFNGRYMKSGGKLYPMYHKAFSEFQGIGVLDVGCHIGFYSLFLSNYAPHVIGLDIDTGLLSTAEGVRCRVGVDNVKFMAASVLDLNAEFFRDNAIEGVFIHKSLSHFSRDEQQRMVTAFIEGGVHRIITNANPKVVKKDSLITKHVRENFGNFKWKRFSPLLICIYLAEGSSKCA